MRRWPVITAIAAAALMLGLSIGPIIADLLGIGARPKIVHVGTPDVGGPFALVDQNGITITNKDLEGKPVIVTFGHRADTDQTRLLLRVLFQTFERMGGSAADIAPVFITVDPETDTPAALKSYAADVSPRLIALSGSPATVGETIKKFRVFVARVPDAEAPGGSRLDYQPLYIVLDARGRYVGHVDFTPSPRQLADELAPLIQIARRVR
jgi:protein SCO1